MRNYNTKIIIIAVLMLLIGVFYYAGIYPFKKNRPYARGGNFIVYDVLDSNVVLTDSIEIFMEASFKNDDVEIRYHGNTVFERRITTDHRVGLSDDTSILRNKEIKNDKLEIIINRNDPVVVQNITKYNYIFISYIEDIPKIILSNKPHYYR